MATALKTKLPQSFVYKKREIIPIVEAEKKKEMSPLRSFQVDLR